MNYGTLHPAGQALGQAGLDHLHPWKRVVPSLTESLNDRAMEGEVSAYLAKLFRSACRSKDDPVAALVPWVCDRLLTAVTIAGPTSVDLTAFVRRMRGPPRCQAFLFSLSRVHFVTESRRVSALRVAGAPFQNYIGFRSQANCVTLHPLRPVAGKESEISAL